MENENPENNGPQNENLENVAPENENNGPANEVLQESSSFEHFLNLDGSLDILNYINL